MGANDVRAGGAFVEIGGLSKGVEAALDRAAGKLKAFGSTVASIGSKMAAMGAVVTAPLIAAATASAQAGAAIYDMSQRTGISVENLSSLGFAAKMTGSNLEELEPSLKRMQKTIGGVADATEGTTGNLEHLGIAMEDIRGKSPDEQFRMIAAALNNISDPTEKAAAAMKVFGRSGTDVLPMIGQLGDLEKTARKLGLVKSTESARSAKEYEQALTLVGIAGRKVWDTIASGLIPVLKEKAELLVRISLGVRDWMAANKKTVVTIFEVAAAVTAAGLALVVLGKTISLVGVAVGGVSSAFTAFRTVVGGAGAILTTILSSGIGLVIAALAGLAAYLLYNSKVGQQALGQLGEYFGQLKTTALLAFQGIKDALAAGDWALAARILWLGVKVAFEEGIAPLRAIWVGFKKVFLEVGEQAFNGIITSWEAVRNALTDSWIKTTSFLASLWKSFVATIKDLHEDAVDFTSRVMIEVGVGGLSSQQKNEAALSANQTHEANKKNIADEEAAAAQSIQDSKDKALAAEKARHDAAVASNQSEHDQQMRQIEERAAAESDADLAKKRALEAELAAATKKAKAESSATPKLLPSLPPPKLPSAADISQAITKAVTSSGTFNAFGVRGLGGGTAAERTAKATESTADTVKKIYGRGGAPGPAFS